MRRYFTFCDLVLFWKNIDILHTKPKPKVNKNVQLFGTPFWICFYLFFVCYLSLKGHKRIDAILRKNEPRRRSPLNMIWWHSANRDVLPWWFQPYDLFNIPKLNISLHKLVWMVFPEWHHWLTFPPNNGHPLWNLILE